MSDLDSHYAEVAARLRSLADAEAAPAMAAYMKDQFVFLGVKTPVRRKAQRSLTKWAKTAPADELLSVAERCWGEPERELQYVGADVLRAGAGQLRAGDLAPVRRFVEAKSWWDTVDSLAAHTVGVMVRNHPELTAEMDRWIDDENIWVARTAILHQLSYKADLDEARLFDYAERRAADTEFFIRKALGWALRNHARVAPEAVRRFVADHDDELSGLTKREALKRL